MGKKKAKALRAWSELTVEDLQSWVGERTFSRGYRYQRNGAVTDLARAGDDTALAWVEGTETYATRVMLRPGSGKRRAVLSSDCSCPVGDACKHAVAVTLDYAEATIKGTELPIAGELDPRWALLDGDEPPSTREHASRGVRDEPLRKALAAKPVEELVNLLIDAARRDEQLRATLQTEQAKQTGDWHSLLRKAQQEVSRLTAEEAWSNGWYGGGHVPDYSGLRRLLNDLLAAGCVDPLVDLGRDLFERGIVQVECSNDEGETCGEIAKTLEVIAKAVVQSGLTAEEKLLMAIDYQIADDFDLAYSFCSVIDAQKDVAVWSAVADALIAKLEKAPVANKGIDDWSEGYHRCRVSDWVIRALDVAKRSDEATEVALTEASCSGEYVRAVDRLLQAKRVDDAEAVAMEGLLKTKPRYAGVIRQLIDRLKTIAGKKKDWTVFAALEADSFFSSPHLASYKALLKAAKKAKCLLAVRKAALSFLDKGVRPDPDSRAGREPVESWPLPEPTRSDDYQSDGRPPTPNRAVLIDIAIDAKDASAVLHWYDQKRATSGPPSPHFARTQHNENLRVAKAIRVDYPQRAEEIYMHVADELASLTSTKEYPEAVTQLKAARQIAKRADRLDQWEDQLDEFHHKHRRKRSLIALLDAAKLKSDP